MVQAASDARFFGARRGAVRRARPSRPDRSDVVAGDSVLFVGDEFTHTDVVAA